MEKIATRNYEEAVSLLQRALPYAIFEPELAMAYNELAFIYRERNDLIHELYAREQIAKYTANPRVRDESIRRVNEIKKHLTRINRTKP